MGFVYKVISFNSPLIGKLVMSVVLEFPRDFGEGGVRDRGSVEGGRFSSSIRLTKN